VDWQVPEQRQHGRVPLDAHVEVIVKGSAEPVRGISKDISLGGMQLRIEQSLAFGAEILIQLTLPGQRDLLALPAVVRWVRGDLLGAQFGLLGARETFAITELLTKGP
jgi:type IV pilus assembly protein PilZ